MNRYIDVPCPTAAERPDDSTPRGTLWLHNRYVKKWYLTKSCPWCKQVHMPEHIRVEHLVITPGA